MNIELDKITLKINDQTLELTLKQCEELKKILDKLIDNKPEWTITSSWPKETTYFRYPNETSPYPEPTITWCETNQINKDYTITATNQN